MTYLTELGWLHEDDKSGEGSATAEAALLAYVRYVRGSYEDEEEERHIDTLVGEHNVFYYEEKTLESEEQREEELIGLADPEWLEDLEIGGRYYIARHRVGFDCTISEEPLTTSTDLTGHTRGVGLRLALDFRRRTG